MTLSACLIVKDEAALLPRCLASLAPWVDELVVVDTGSTDETVAIARQAGARVAHFTWSQDFAAARNAALELARGDWVWSVDADEWWQPGEPAAWATALAQPHVAWKLKIVNALDGREPQASAVVRLFRRDPRFRYVRRIHENVEEAIARAGYGWGTFDGGVLVHDGYLEARFLERGKAARNFELARLEVEAHPADPQAWLLLGRAGFERQHDMATALAAFAEVEKLLRAGRSLAANQFLLFADYQARALFFSGARAQAIQALRRAIAVAPRPHDLGSLLAHFESQNA